MAENAFTRENRRRQLRSIFARLQDQADAVEYWSYFQPNDVAELASKHDADLQYGCQQLDAKTVFLMDTSNFVCNDKFYCCVPAKRLAVGPPNANNM